MDLTQQIHHALRNKSEISENIFRNEEITKTEVNEKSLFLGKSLKFKRNLNRVEQKVFQQYFERRGSYGDVITLQDIRNLTLFTLKSKISKEFLKFVFSESFNDFLHATVFYIDYFLMVLELVLIRRDEEIKERKIRDSNSITIEASISRRLSHRRLLLSREFSKVSLFQLVWNFDHSMKCC